MQVYNDELYHYGVKGMKWDENRKLSISKDQYATFKPNYVINRKLSINKDKYATFNPNYVINRKPLNNSYRMLRTTPINETNNYRVLKTVKPSTTEQIKTLKNKQSREYHKVYGKNLITKLYYSKGGA